MMVSDSIQQIKARLPELYEIDFGYPLGENVVSDVDRLDGLPSDFALTKGAEWLDELYSECDGLSFPDVHVGYFLKSLERVLAFDRLSEPDVVILDREINVLPIGSTGGGSLFVVGCDRGNVMLLAPGFLRDGRYDGRTGKVTEVAATVPGFVERLLSDLTAFIADDKHHNYIA